MTAGVIIPVKSFGEAKRRLASALSTDQRRRLARSCVERVVAAASPLPVWLVTDDDGVADWAPSVGTQALLRPGRDLNQSITDAVSQLSELSTLIVSHGDLPLARDLPRLLDGHDKVTLVPDRHRDGTNVVVVATGSGFRFSYGPRSFHRHIVESRRIGADVRVLTCPALAWDIDHPADLDHPEVAELLAELER